MAKEKNRLDEELVRRGLVETRSKAKALILAGCVFSETKKLSKAGEQVSLDIPLNIKTSEHPWVSRGGLKLDHAIKTFNLSPKDKIVFDIGASTGGFTDVLLHYGAKQIFAIDVGHGQLAWKLRNHEKVVVLEKTNARHITYDHVKTYPDWVVCDASFISLKKVLPNILHLLEQNKNNTGILIALIKPQFELEKNQIGKGGVVKDTTLHDFICNHIKDWVSSLNGWSVLGIEASPILGPKGNKEFLLYAEFSCK